MLTERGGTLLENSKPEKSSSPLNCSVPHHSLSIFSHFTTQKWERTKILTYWRGNQRHIYIYYFFYCDMWFKLSVTSVTLDMLFTLSIKQRNMRYGTSIFFCLPDCWLDLSLHPKRFCDWQPRHVFSVFMFSSKFQITTLCSFFFFAVF